jgi:glycine cleavage system H protein
MAQPSDRFYARTHEWVKIEGDAAVVGISHFAQEQLGDVVFVELPAVGKQLAKDGAMGNIESVKAVSEVFAPVAGSVTAVNTELEAHPELLNQDPYGAGWLVQLHVAPGAAAGLMDAAAYEAFLAEEGAH